MNQVAQVMHKVRFLLANIYFESENFQQAEIHYRQLLERPNNDWSLVF